MTVAPDNAVPAVRPAGPAWRPRYHYTPQVNWLSDPNGLVWHAGEWHLYYQFNPHSDQWGHMSWGHAVSRDLVTWGERPVAIAEDARHMIFSGSAVSTMWHGQPVVAALYTGAERGAQGRQVQCLAISHDAGHSFEKYAGNPVIDAARSDFRDPNVFWHAASGRWIMVAVHADASMAVLYASADLVQWEPLSSIGPFAVPGHTWECPALIELPVTGADGQASGTYWLFKVDVLHLNPDVRGSGAIGVAGRFDGTHFVPDTHSDGTAAWRWIDHGRDFYAAIPWNGAPPGDAARYWIGWLGNHAYQAALPPTGWRGAMTLPRVMDWVDRGGTLRLRQRPVPALTARCAGLGGIDRAQLHGGESVVLGEHLPRALRVRMRVALPAAGGLTLGVDQGAGAAWTLLCDGAARTLMLDRSEAGGVDGETDGGLARFAAPMIAPLDGDDDRVMTVDLDIWIDDHCVEIFAQDGTLCLSAMTFLVAGPLRLTLIGWGDGAAVSDLIWEEVRI